MKRSVKAHSTHIGPVRLYREDIVTLIELVRSTCKALKIEIGEYEFESVEELIQSGPAKATTFDISASDPYFHVGRSLTGIHVYSGSDSTQSTGMFFQTTQLLEKCRLRPRGSAQRFSILRFLLPDSRSDTDHRPRV